MCPIDFCHPCDCVHPHLVRSRIRGAACAAWTPRGVLGSARLTGGIERFTTLEPASADRRERVSRWRVPHGLSHQRGRFLPTARTVIEPLTPLSRSAHASRLPRFRGGCTVAVPSAFGLGTRVGGASRAPRSPVSVSRDRERSVMIGDAFRRQETLRRIRWSLQPRSRDRCTASGDVATAG